MSGAKKVFADNACICQPNVITFPMPKKISPYGLVMKSVEAIDHEATGIRFRKLRESACISLRSMSRRLNCSAAWLSDLELGKRQWSEEWAKNYSDWLNLKTE